MVDYKISTDSIKHRTANFIVGDLNNFSDHSPLYLKLDCSLPTKNLLKVQNFENAPKRFLWNANCDPERFKSAHQNEDIRGAIEKMCSLKCQNSDDVYECNEMLVKLYQKLARNSLASCTQAKKVHARKGNHHEPWFTAELLREKRRVNKHNRWLSKHPEDSQLRAKLFQLKKDYKKHLRRKKEEFIKRVNKEIEEGKEISWDGFKKLKSYSQHPNSLDLYDMTNFINFFKCLYSTVD